MLFASLDSSQNEINLEIILQYVNYNSYVFFPFLRWVFKNVYWLKG